jgi:YD repeat-containing protein
MYQIARNFTVRITLSFTVCASLLLLPSVSLLSEASSQAVRNVRPGRKRPEGTLPDLEEVKKESRLEREALPPIPSTVRAKRNEGKPWDGRRVGDPGTSQRPLDQPEIRRAHARRRLAPPPLYEDQFIQNFFSLALLRSPNPDETLYWNNLLRAGYNQNQTSLKLAAIEFGRTLFESASYASRNRDAHSYVYDLYKTYLMREPDAGGWSYWEALVPTNGREYVRRGFEESGELATLLASISLSGSVTNPSSLITARVDPRNQPGNGMLSRDVSWSVPLLSLPGRNGLDLGLALSYSSIVWTAAGPYFYFDEDNGFPSPGFRLGFPTVQRRTFDAQTGKNVYLLITPAGRRVELRQTTTSTVYEAADSSYLQLTETGGTLLVRSTDGTQLSLAEVNNEYRCTQIKDRNGNFISVNYNTLGQITTITDTLARAITFNYDSNANLISITQEWNGQPSHQWVSFGWSTRNMQYAFADPAVVGIKNNVAVPVVTQVALNDTSYFTFDYTNPLQVSQIKNYFGGTERNATSFGYQTLADGVPRMNSSSVSAQNWTGVNGMPAQITTTYEVAGDGACMLTAPDGTIYKEYYGTGWQKGLTTLSEIWSGGLKQKWTTTTWTQDNTAVSYETNPRVTETNIYDASGNRRRTVIDYGQYAQWGLPYGVREFAADGVTELRQTWTDYNLSQAYLDRRIIGLVSQVHLTNVSSWQGKVRYDYDDPARLSALPASATQHDSAYNTSLTARGNVTSVSQWDFTDIANPSKALTSYTNYFITGTPASATDPATHTSTINYTDAFSDAVNRNTFAYPTTLTDADGYSSTVQYNFDIGATTRTQSPAPAGQSQGAIQTMTYNSLGQLDRVTTVNNGAYKRFWYGPNYVASYATVNNVADELYAIQVTDGAGRVIGAASNHPGSSGGYSLVNTIYDQMGRLWKQSNPTEINNSWIVTGDAGIYYTQQTYDWKGRPLVTTNTDLTTKTASYSGCGCAGGEVVTLTDEVNRRQKLYSDVLGREWKTEILNWDGSVYSTGVSVFNVRDQITRIRQYAGVAPPEASSTNEAASCPSGTCQETSMAYDGYGRLQSKHRPEQNPGTTTIYAYNMDDTLSSSTDARGAITSYGYNGRHLVTSVTSALTGLSTMSNAYSYDAAGNRTLMSHTIGGVLKDSASYTYDELSRMTSESVSLKDLQNYAPNYGNYTIGYEYTLSNQLKKVIDPFNSPTEIAYDELGRTKTVTGTWNGTNYTYASDVSYRAWGAVKSVSFDGQTKATTYNSSMRPTHYGAYDYTYYDDGKLKEFRDQSDQVGNPQSVQFHYMSRRYSYDHAGRISSVGQLQNYSIMPPFSGSYGYDAFDNLISRSGNYAINPTQSDSGSYTNNRRTGWTYNAEGKITNSSDNSDSGGSSTRAWTYDAAGSLIFTSETRNGQTTTLSTGYDGDGKVNHEIINNSTGDYLIHSSVLGTLLTKLKVNGGKDITYVPANGLVYPMQMQDQPGSNPVSYVVWVSRDPLAIQENKNGYLYAIDPFGSLVANVQPPSGGPPPYMPFYGATYGGLTWNSFINANNFSGGCLLDGRPTDCNQLKQRYNDGFLNFDVPSGLTGSTRYRPQLPPGYFETRGEFGHARFFVTGPVFSDPEHQDTLPGDLRARVQDIGRNCQDLLNRFFGALGSKVNSADLGTLYDRIKTIELSQKPFDKHEDVSDADGLALGDGDNRQIYVKPIPSNLFEHFQRNEHYQEFRWNAIAKIVVQELLHHARNSGTFSDSSLDTAALKLMNPAEQAAARKMMTDNKYKVGSVGHRLIGSNCNVTNPFGPPPRN